MTTDEQWKTDGDCSLCRRREYCKKICTKAKSRVRNFFWKRLAELAIPGVREENKDDSV